MRKFLAFSGGKDSTAMAYRLRELGEDFELLFTSTDNELPAVAIHIEATRAALGVPLVIPPGPKLLPLIDSFGALPNHRQRWCTRMIKIQPCLSLLKQNPGSTLIVGLRADEPTREGLYGSDAIYRLPMRDWDWSIDDVKGYLKKIGVTVPKRTDCAFCYAQRLTEWFSLWRDEPALYAKGIELEVRTGHTFRSPSRDTWPASLADLGREFHAGRRPRGQDKHDGAVEPCRVCRM